MFARFRQNPNRIQVSLIEAKRVDGKVRHKYVASLGSFPTPPTVADRIAFWQKLHARLARLSNSVDAATCEKVLGAVHERIPMVTPDEQAAIQLVNAEAEANLWNTLGDMHRERIEENKRLVATVNEEIAASEAATRNAEANAARAKDRIERLKRGEPVTGGLKAMTLEEVERSLGKKLVRRARIFSSIELAELERISAAEHRGLDRRIERAARKVSRAKLRSDPPGPSRG